MNTLKRFGPVTRQGVVLGLIASLAAVLVGGNGYLLGGLDNLKMMYYSQYSDKCQDCTVPSWFQGTRRQWANLVAYGRYDTINTKWAAIVIANLVYGCVSLAYVLWYTLLRTFNKHSWWTAVRLDVAMTGLLGLIGLPPAGVYWLVKWTFGPPWDVDHLSLRSPHDQDHLSTNRVCKDLGRICNVNRLSLGITWPIALLFLAVCVFEILYVEEEHGGGPAWTHSLRALSAVPPHRRRNPQSYREYRPHEYRGGAYSPDILPEGEDAEAQAAAVSPLALHSPSHKGYVGQEDAPPLYVENAGPLESIGLSPVSQSHGEELPSFGESQLAAHKQAVLAKPRPMGL